MQRDDPDAAAKAAATTVLASTFRAVNLGPTGRVVPRGGGGGWGCHSESQVNPTSGKSNGMVLNQS